MNQKNLTKFCHLVLQDISLQERLQATSDKAVFLKLICQLGTERGYFFTEAEVEEQLYASRRAWVERFLCQ